MGISAYSKTAWSNGVAPAINATNLNKIEDRLYDLTEEIITPTMASTTTATQQIISLPSTTLKSRLDLTVAGNTTSGYDSYTKLLMFFEGADGSTTFTDQTGKTVTASGNAQIDTAQYRYGSASGLFDGTGDYLTVTDANDELDIGTQDFTIECWYRPAVLSTQCLIDFRQSTGTDVALNIYMFSDGRLFMQTAGVERINGTTNLAINKWYHIAVVRSGTSTKMFLNGGQEGNTYTDTNNYIGVSTIKIGAFYSNTSTLNGWIDELRISNTARYTSSFIPTTLETLSTDRQIVKSVGKNLFDLSKNDRRNNFVLSSTTGNESSDATFGYLRNFIRVKPNTTYTISGTGRVTRPHLYDSNFTWIARAGTENTFTTPANCIFIRIQYTVATVNFSDWKLEEGSTATTYESYTETSAIIPVELKKISSTVFDTYDANSGQHTKNVSEWVDLTGSIVTGNIEVDYVGYKRFSLFVASLSLSSGKSLTIKYNKKVLTDSSSTVIDNSYLSGTIFKSFLADTDTGFDEAWDGTTSFTGMTFGNLLKAYMNGWKLTTANTNVASCVWTGIASGTTQSGSGGYSHVIANIDVGYTPYRMIYQLATPIITNYYPNTLTAEPSGTIYTYPFVADYDFYDTGAGVNNTAFPIDSLEYVNIVDKATGALTPVDLSTCTVASGGLSFTSTALTADDLVDFGYTYKDLTTVADVIYSHPTDLKATVDGNTNNIRDLDEKIEQSNTFTTLTLKEIERDARILKIMGGI